MCSKLKAPNIRAFELKPIPDMQNFHILCCTAELDRFRPPCSRAQTWLEFYNKMNFFENSWACLWAIAHVNYQEFKSFLQIIHALPILLDPPENTCMDCFKLRRCCEKLITAICEPKFWVEAVLDISHVSLTLAVNNTLVVCIYAIVNIFFTYVCHLCREFAWSISFFPCFYEGNEGYQAFGQCALELAGNYTGNTDKSKSMDARMLQWKLCVL